DPSFQNLAASMKNDITCTICTQIISLPYVLSCGHTACRACLEGWFSELLVQHLERHPHADLPNMQPYYDAIRDPSLDETIRERAIAEATMVLKFHPRPSYTCPICRQILKTKPTGEIALRSIVSSVAHSLGEENPNTGSVHEEEGFWDGFFP
ncbi:uncharacterized protein C8Q71DRAFT_690615, partial [Rhodofomes roseus]